MKDIYNHMVYYLFSFVLFCAPTRVSAQEDPALEEQLVREPRTHEVRPADASSPPAAAPPPQEGQPKANTFSVPETTVSGQKEPEYKAESATTATKTDTPLRDIPQSVSIVTDTLVESQNAFNLRDALKNVSGLTISAAEGGRTGDSISVRGFAANSDFYLDGVKDNGQYIRDTFFMERVEVLKGPSSVLFGRGTTGGVINVISKKAGPRLIAEGEITYGSHDFKRGTIDVGGAVTDFLNLRLNALYQDAGSFRDYNFIDRWGLAPSIGMTLTPDTTLSLQLLHQEEDSVFDYGVPLFRGKPADVPRTTFYGFPDDQLQEYTTTFVTATFDHRFSSNLSVRNTFRYGDYERFYRTHLFGAVTDTDRTSTVARNQHLRLGTQENFYNQTDLVWKTPLFAGMQSTVLFGTEFGWEDFDFRSKNSTDIPSISIFDPVRTPTVGAGRANDLRGELNAHNQAQTDTQAFYLQSQLDITPQWKTLAGFRWDRFATHFQNGAGLRLRRTDEMLSYRFGLTWQPTEWQSYYFSYSNSFNPSGETFSLNTSTVNLEPEENQNFEIGAKLDFLDGNLSATAAIFRLEKTNARTPDPIDPDRTILAGVQRTDGIEFGVTGSITPNWHVAASYAYLDATIVDSNALQNGIPIEGHSPANVSPNNGVVWTSYYVTDALEVGGGVFFQDRQFLTNSHIAKIPGFTRFDGMVAYHHKHFDVQLNLFNVADERYFEWGRSNAALPGRPFAAEVTFRVKY
ncbi:MAG: TonB-dependent receptor [Candidatus Binatia bacterium]